MGDKIDKDSINEVKEELFDKLNYAIGRQDAVVDSLSLSVSKFSISVAMFTLIITLLITSVGFISYWKIKAEAEEVARVSAENYIEEKFGKKIRELEVSIKNAKESLIQSRLAAVRAEEIFKVSQSNQLIVKDLESKSQELHDAYLQLRDQLEIFKELEAELDAPFENKVDKTKPGDEGKHTN